MDRRTADRLIVLLLGVVGFGGIYSSWLAYQRSRAMDGMMGSMMGGSMPTGAGGVSTAIGTVLAIVVVGGLYLVVREAITEPAANVDSNPSTSGLVPSTSGTGEEADGPVARPALLDVLPDDERRVLEPVVESPGITQIELRDRSGFSTSKVSQTVSDLEKRGLLYRERQGRTYRVYPDASVTDGDPG